MKKATKKIGIVTPVTPAAVAPAPKTAPAQAKAVPFSHPPRAFPMDKAHAGNMGKSSK